MVYRLLHTADLHLDRAFGYLPAPVARQRRRDLRLCLDRVLELAQAERVDAIAIAGDLYEHTTATPDLEHLLQTRFAALAPIRVFLAPGNHDPLVAGSLYRRTAWSSNVHLFGSDGWTVESLAPGLDVWGTAFLGPERRDNPFAAASPGRAALNLAVLHASAATIENDGPYAPFLPSDPANAGFALAMLGHLHQGQADRQGSHPTWIYPGTPEPLDFGETGPRSVVLVTANPSAGTIDVERRELDSTRYYDAELPVDGASTVEEIVGAARELAAGRAEWRGQYVRLRLRGRCRLPDTDLGRDLAAALDAAFVLVEDATTAPWNLDALAQEPTIRGTFVRRLRRRLAGATDAERRLYEQALAYGLEALDGRTPVTACD